MLMFKIVVHIIQVYRRYISGSPRAHVTLSGDVIGPIFPGDEPVSLGTMFPSGNGRSVNSNEVSTHLQRLAKRCACFAAPQLRQKIHATQAI